MIIERVPLQYVNQVWPLAAPHLDSALEHVGRGDYTLDHVQALVSTGTWALLVASEDKELRGAATVELFNRPTARVAMITLIGGKMISSQDTFEQLKQILRQMGATTIEGAAREAIARLWSRYGFEEKYRIVGVKI